MSITNYPINGQSLKLGVTNQGLDSCLMGSRQAIVSGGLSLANLPVAFTTGKSTSYGAQVIHKHSGGVQITYSYSLKLNDIQVTIELQNFGTQALTTPGFRLPTFQFTKNANGNMHAWHPTYLNARGFDLYHPGIMSPLGCAYAYDDQMGICLDISTPLRTLINADWVQDGIIPAICAPNIYVDTLIPPGGNLSLILNIRVIPFIKVETLVSHYVSIQKLMNPPIQYVPDQRPVVGSWPESKTWVTPDSPLGLHPQRRLDLPIGVDQYSQMLTPSIGASQGTIFWQPQGYNPRTVIDGWYRPDFNCFPATVIPQRDAFIKWLKANGLKFMLLAQPRYDVTPVTWDSDWQVEVEGPTTLERLISRFKEADDFGIEGYYFDMFGDRASDLPILLAIRRIIGSKITFSEYITDVSLPWTAAYTELTDAIGNTKWLSAETIRILRLIEPRSTFIAKNPLGLTLAPSDYATMRMTPLVEDWLCGGTPDLKEFTTKYLNGKDWK